MEEREFQQFCEMLQAGESKYVENVGSHEKGRVLFCSGNRLEVEVGDRRETWGREYCQAAEPPSA